MRQIMRGIVMGEKLFEQDAQRTDFYLRMNEAAAKQSKAADPKPA